MMGSELAKVFSFLAGHPEIIETARQAIECGCTEDTIVSAIKSAMKVASDEQMKKELGA